MPNPANQKSSKSSKKTTEKQLEDAANEEQDLGEEDTLTSGEESESDAVDTKVRKAATKDKSDRQEIQCALKINIKHTKGQSQHSSYRSYNIRTKRGSRGWRQSSLTQGLVSMWWASRKC